MSEVAERLANPSRRLSFAELAEAWFMARIAVRIEGMAGLAHNLDLLRRVRGGIGRVLMQSASPEAIAGRPCPWDPPCALDVLFREQGRVGAHGIPKPFVLAAEPRGRDLIVSMTLFGFASDWSAAAAHALLAAVQHRIDWRGLRPYLFVPRLRIAGVATDAIEGVRLPAWREIVEMQFLTPMNAEGDNPLERPATVFARLARRIQGLTQWHDAAIETDWAALAAAWGNLAYDTGSLHIEHAWRRSGTQARSYEPPTVRGMLRITDVPLDLWSLLAIGQEAHVGKGAGEGFGRFLLV
ncbi:MAG: CRISPR system precrRNA processing endoribonuclease RAMP protein Cas6 [Alphaproteobacteria bacterium]